AEEAARPGERAGAELGEAVDAAVGGDDVVGRLRAAVEADDERPPAAGPGAREGVDEGALALVAEAAAEDGDRSLGTGLKCQVATHRREGEAGTRRPPRSSRARA